MAAKLSRGTRVKQKSCFRKVVWFFLHKKSSTTNPSQKIVKQKSFFRRKVWFQSFTKNRLLLNPVRKLLAIWCWPLSRAKTVGHHLGGLVRTGQRPAKIPYQSLIPSQNHIFLLTFVPYDLVHHVLFALREQVCPEPFLRKSLIIIAIYTRERLRIGLLSEMLKDGLKVCTASQLRLILVRDKGQQKSIKKV